MLFGCDQPFLWGERCVTSQKTGCEGDYVAYVASVPVPRERNSGSAKEFFSHWGCTKIEVIAKEWKEESGRGKRRERLPANPSILKNPFATNGAPDSCGVAILMDKCIKFA